ncbi:hypothetical protein LSH36_275g06021 [Paralvinella palmiformis]|uniref:Importin N-terminal domain-containing protein n=1 Tax=Paralvinella palmiformis TaxID=53620 RepID=A0AAD9N3Z1_9ANNE|nr:hypothetical protein LSH36_275g06021 [Paralvinella palmiformis]
MVTSICNLVHKIIGFAPTLLQLVMSEQVDIPVRQAGVIYLKKMVCQFWEQKEPATVTEPVPFFIHEQDKQVIRDNVVEAVITTPQPVRVQLAVCISQLIKYDYPARWPGIAEKVAMYLQSDAHNTWMGALICLYQLVKNFEFKKPEERLTLNQAMHHILPIIQQRCLQLMADQSEPAILLQKQILKVFFALIQFHLPLDLITKEMFTQWMELVRQIIDKPIPEHTSQVDEDERPELSWWKLKKWACHIVTRCFERYGSPGSVMKEYTEFARWYLKSFSGGILAVLLKLLDQYRQKQYVSPRVLQQILNYLNIGVDHAFSWKIIKPHMLVIIQKIIFPLMCHTDEDQELWESDPAEYIRVKYDVFQEFFSPVTAAQTLLCTVVTRRKEMLQRTMGFIMAILTNNDGPTDPRHKAGALHMVGAVAETLLQKKIYKDQAEGMIIQHVFPEFASPHGYLRARACWVLNHFSEVKFKQPTTLEKAVELTRLAMCTDKELPVRVEGAVALQQLLGNQDKAKDFLLPHLGTIVLELLKIIRETESDDLTSVMQKIVCVYQEEIAPLALEICTHLAETFAEVLNSSTDSDEKAILAMGILNTLDTIVTVMEDQKEVIQNIEGVVLNVIGLILQQNLMEFYDESLTLIYSLTSKFVSERMWNVFPLLYDIFKNDGFDYFTDMMPALHNYITVDPDHFIANPRNMEIIYDMCKTIMAADSGEDAECHAAKLLEVLLIQFKGKIDQVVPLFIELALERLTREVKTSELRTMCLQVVIAALYYNPSMLFELLEKIHMPNTNQPITQQFLKQWMQDTDCFLGLHDRKICVLGLCMLLDTTGNRPQEITSIAGDIIPACIMLFDGLKRAYQYRAEQEDSSDEESDEEEFVAAELDDDDDVIDEEGEQYLEKLGRITNADEVGEDCDEEDYESEETPLESYETPLDRDETEVDEYQVFKNVLQNLEHSDPAWYHMLMAQLNESQQKQLQEIFSLAEKRRAAMESKKIEQRGGYVFNQTVVPGSFNFGGVPPQ